MSLLTECTHTIPELRDILAAQLATSGGVAWNVVQYHGTSAAGMLDLMLAASLPAAVVYWRGETANKEPGRPQRTYNEMHVMLIAADAQAADGADTAQAMLDAIKSTCDNFVSGNSVWRYMGAEAVDLSEESQAPNLACIDATLEVGDH